MRLIPMLLLITAALAGGPAEGGARRPDPGPPRRLGLYRVAASDRWTLRLPDPVEPARDIDLLDWPRPGTFRLGESAWELLGLAVAAGMAGVYLSLWRLARRQRRIPPQPQSTPPDGLGPAAVRYLWRMGYDGEVFAAAITSLAAKGVLRFAGEDDFTAFERGRADRADLTEDEIVVANALFADAGRVGLELGRRGAVRRAAAALRRMLRDRFEESHFTGGADARTVLLAGVVLILVAAAALASFFGTLLVFLLMVWTGASLAVLRQVSRTWRAVVRGEGSVLIAVGLSLLVPLCLAATAAAFVYASKGLPFAFVLAAIAVIALRAAFHNRLIRTTALGGEVRARIAGFRDYLTGPAPAAETALEPADRAELYNRRLAYAMALGVGPAWSAKFRDLHDAASPAARTPDPTDPTSSS